MNIGIVTTWFERGAAYVSRQYQQILEKEHEIFIFARGGEQYSVDDPTWNMGNVTWSKQLPFAHKTSFDLKEFRAWLKKHSIEMVIFNEQHWWPPILTCHDEGILTGAYVDYYTEETVKLFNSYDFLICNTKRHYSVFDWHHQCYYVPWGTDIQLFSPKQKDRVKSEYVTFFHSCGYSPFRKGTDLLLESFRTLSPSSRLIVHTQRSLSDALPEHLATIRQLVEDGRLEIIEKTVGAPGLYHLGDVYVYPTRLEGIGLTIPEALACGLPVIAPNHPPMSEFVTDYVEGRLAEVTRMVARFDGYYWPQVIVNTVSLADTMRFYAERPEEIVRFGERARQSAEQLLDWSTNGAVLLEIVRNVRKRSTAEMQKTREEVTSFEAQRTSFVQKHRGLFAFLLRLSNMGKSFMSRR